MGTAFLFDGKTSAELASFTGIAREIKLNTSTWDLHVMDGATPGGHVVGSAAQAAAEAARDAAQAAATNIQNAITIDGEKVGIGVVPTQKFESSGPVVSRGSLTASQTNAAVMSRSGDECRLRAYGSTPGSGYWTFRIGGGGGSADTEGMRLTSTGLGVQNTNPQGPLEIGTFSATGASKGRLFDDQGRTESSSTNITTGANHCVFYNPNGAVGSILTLGSSTVYSTSSDYRLKENETLITDSWDRILRIPVYDFNFKADPDKIVSGFFAHELQTVIPEAVTGEKDAMRTEEYEVKPAVYETVVIPAVEEELDEEGNIIVEAQPETTKQVLISEAVMGTREVPDYQGVDQSKVVPLLTAAVQDLINTVTDLTNRIAVLEAA